MLYHVTRLDSFAFPTRRNEWSSLFRSIDVATTQPSLLFCLCLKLRRRYFRLQFLFKSSLLPSSAFFVSFVGFLPSFFRVAVVMLIGLHRLITFSVLRIWEGLPPRRPRVT